MKFVNRNCLLALGITLLIASCGSTLIYTTDGPEVIQAIHDWFTAQTSDHGAHAEHTS